LDYTLFKVDLKIGDAELSSSPTPSSLGQSLLAQLAMGIKNAGAYIVCVVLNMKTE
jgi:hypothetical protein